MLVCAGNLIDLFVGVLRINLFIKLQEIIAQIMSVEAIIARARSLKAKFGVEKCENEEEKEDLQR